MNRIRLTRIVGGFLMLAIVALDIHTVGVDLAFDIAMGAVGLLAIYVGVVDSE